VINVAIIWTSVGNNESYFSVFRFYFHIWQTRICATSENFTKEKVPAIEILFGFIFFATNFDFTLHWSHIRFTAKSAGPMWFFFNFSYSIAINILQMELSLRRAYAIAWIVIAFCLLQIKKTGRFFKFLLPSSLSLTLSMLVFCFHSTNHRSNWSTWMRHLITWLIDCIGVSLLAHWVALIWHLIITCWLTIWILLMHFIL
jgi:hypothetical protein